MTQKAPTTWKKRLLMLMLLIVGGSVLGTGVLMYSLNNPETQRKLLQYVNTHSAWNIETDGWQWDLINATMRVDDLALTHRISGHKLSTKRLEIDYNPWALLWATVKINTLKLDATTLHLESMPEPRKQRRVSLSKLLLLRNIDIEDATLSALTLHLPKEYAVQVRNIHLQYTPRWFRDVRVYTEISDLQVDHPTLTTLTSQRLTVTGQTKVRKWIDRAPYINGLTGSVIVQHAEWKDTPVDFGAAQFALNDGAIALHDIDARADGKHFQGHAAVNLDDTSSSARVEWVDPMPIPNLMHDESFLLTAGDIQGHIAWSGQGFTPDTLTGTAEVDLRHEALEHTTEPLHIVSTGNIENGVITLQDSALHIGNSTTQVEGSINIPQQDVTISVSGTNIPVDGILGRFRNTNFHPARGFANCTGTFRGWKKDYRFDLDVRSEGPLHYYDILAESVQMQMQQTHPELHLQGSIWQQGVQTGTVNMDMQFGKAPEGSRSRSATIQLTADLKNHDLLPSFPEMGLTGTGNTQLSITGPTTNYRGTGHFTITEGLFQGVPIESMRSTIRLAPQRIEFSPSTIKIANVPELVWPGTIVMDIDQGMRMRGAPTAHLNLDLAYDSASQAWTYHHIRYQHPEFAGPPLTIAGSGKSLQWDIAMQGTADASWLQAFPERFRETAGPLAMNLKIQGDMSQPQVHGTVELDHNWMMLRGWPQEWNELQGTLQFSDRRITLANLHGFVGDGPVTLTGWAEHEGTTIPRFDIELTGRSLSHVTDDRHFRMEFDTTAQLTQLDGVNMKITGDLAIIDALYDKDFHVLEHATQRAAHGEREKFRARAAGHDKIHLALNTSSQGEIRIRNNVADLALRANVFLGGTVSDPIITGNFETTDGEIHYLGLAFDVRNGTLAFNDGEPEPFIEFQGEKDVGNHLVQVTMRGPADNMQIDLQSVPGQDRRDILCLIAYGASCDNVRTAQFGAKVGPGILVEQVGKILQKPLEQLTGLDVVRVESPVGTTDLSSLHIGKRFSDRLELGFVTTVGNSAGEQSIEASYQITDSFLLKAQTGSNTGVKMSVRLRER